MEQGLVPLVWITDRRPLWLRALESRILQRRVDCGATSISTGKRCRCRAFVLNRRGEPRCGNHARS